MTARTPARAFITALMIIAGFSMINLIANWYGWWGHVEDPVTVRQAILYDVMTLGVGSAFLAADETE